MRFRLGIGIVVVSTWLLFGAAAATPRTPPRHHPSSPAQRIAAAQKGLRKLPSKSFAHGQKKRTLGLLSKAGHGLRSHHFCPAIDAVDQSHSLLLLASTWRHGVPKVVSRTISRSL